MKYERHHHATVKESADASASVSLQGGQYPYVLYVSEPGKFVDRKSTLVTVQMTAIEAYELALDILRQMKCEIPQ